jgi:hypothetical protein
MFHFKSFLERPIENVLLIRIANGTASYPLKINLKVVPSPCLDLTWIFPL